MICTYTRKIQIRQKELNINLINLLSPVEDKEKEVNLYEYMGKV